MVSCARLHRVFCPALFMPMPIFRGMFGQAMRFLSCRSHRLTHSCFKGAQRFTMRTMPASGVNLLVPPKDAPTSRRQACSYRPWHCSFFPEATAPDKWSLVQVFDTEEDLEGLNKARVFPSTCISNRKNTVPFGGHRMALRPTYTRGVDGATARAKGKSCHGMPLAARCELGARTRIFPLIFDMDLKVTSQDVWGQGIARNGGAQGSLRSTRTFKHHGPSRPDTFSRPCRLVENQEDQPPSSIRILAVLAPKLKHCRLEPKSGSDPRWEGWFSCLPF